VIRRIRSRAHVTSAEQLLGSFAVSCPSETDEDALLTEPSTPSPASVPSLSLVAVISPSSETVDRASALDMPKADADESCMEGFSSTSHKPVPRFRDIPCRDIPGLMALGGWLIVVALSTILISAWYCLRRIVGVVESRNPGVSTLQRSNGA